MKKNSDLRLFIDYKDRNAIIIKNCCFLLLIIEILNYLNDVNYFTKFNLKIFIITFVLNEIINKKRRFERDIILSNDEVYFSNSLIHRQRFKFILTKD